MTEFEDQIKKALEELKDSKERKFNQSVDFIVNLQKFDVRKNPLNLFIKVPHKIKDKKVAAFLESKNKNVDTITFEEFKKYNDKTFSFSLIKKLG